MQKIVYFYATCLGSAAMQEMVLNGIKLLRKEGVEVIFKKTKPVAPSRLLTRAISTKARLWLCIMLSFLMRIILSSCLAARARV